MDIKQRLQAGIETPPETILAGGAVAELYRDALAEIERLETSLRTISEADPVPKKQSWYDAWHELVWLAEEALDPSLKVPRGRNRKVAPLERIAAALERAYPPQRDT